MSGGEGEVREGFLCPLCMKDLGDVVQLQVGNKNLAFHCQNNDFRFTLRSRIHGRTQLLLDHSKTFLGKQRVLYRAMMMWSCLNKG